MQLACGEDIYAATPTPLERQTRRSRPYAASTRALTKLLATGLLAAVLGSAIAGRAPAQTTASRAKTLIDLVQEYNVKAVYLYSFGRYTTWPSSALAQTKGVFVIGVLGQDPFHGALDRIAQKERVDSRRIEVRRFKSLDDYRPCQILFLPRSLPPAVERAAIEKLRGKSVLLVGERPGFASSGGIIGFYIQDATVRFEINLEAARLHGLKLDSRLIGLARVVQTQANPAAEPSREQGSGRSTPASSTSTP